MTTTTRVTGRQVIEAIETVKVATVQLCESLLKQHGTQSRAARAIGVTQGTFSKLSSGAMLANLDLLAAMAAEVVE